MTHTIPLHYSPSLPCIVLLLLASLLLLGMSVLTSCGGNAPDSESPSRTDRPAAETTTPNRTAPTTDAAVSPSIHTQEVLPTTATSTLLPPFSTEIDRDTLLLLYNGTDGPNWHYNDNWLTSAPWENGTASLPTKTGV